MLGRVLWSQDWGGRGSVGLSAATLRPLLPPAPGSAEPCIASREDRPCPRLSDEPADRPGARTLSTLLPETRGVLVTHRAQGASGARAPAPQAPGHRGSQGTAAEGRRRSSLGRLDVHFRNPWFPSESTFQVPTCLRLLPLAPDLPLALY